MATFSIPDDKGIRQPNEGDSRGNVFMTYGIDLESEKGRVQVSAQVKKLISDADNADFDGYAGSIGAYSQNGSTGKIFAVSDKAFSADFSTPLGTWDEETTGAEPDSGNTIMDSAFFDGLFLVSEALDIKSWNGSTWVSWWQGTLGRAALASGQRHLMKVGPKGDLHIVDGGNKLYRVTATETVNVSGNGTLDISPSSHEMSCMTTNSTRLWVGTRNLANDEAIILEWDATSSTTDANKVHYMGAKAVRCIAIWNDTPIAILSNGKAKYFNGFSFVEFKEPCQFNVTSGYQLDDNFIHPNGWAIIDDLPHFLVTGRVENASSTTGTQLASYQMPAGIYALDPSIGLYHRFALGAGEATQQDYGKMQIKEVGALYSLQKNESKFLASYEYAIDDGITNRSVLVYHDAANTKPSRGFLMTPFAYSLREMWKKVEVFHKELATGEKLRIYYRNKKQEALAKSGTWLSTTEFNIVGTSLGITKGDVAFIKTGKGSGQLLRVDAVEESSSVTSITFTEPNTFAVLNDNGTLDFLNFRFMGEVNSTTKDYEEFTIPESGRKRKMQFLLEFQQAVGNTMELDYSIINT